MDTTIAWIQLYAELSFWLLVDLFLIILVFLAYQRLQDVKAYPMYQYHLFIIERSMTLALVGIFWMNNHVTQSAILLIVMYFITLARSSWIKARLETGIVIK